MARAKSFSCRRLLLAVAILLPVAFAGIVPSRSVAQQRSNGPGDANRGSTEKAATAKEKILSDDVLTVRGRVLDPDGKPLAAADILIVRWYWGDDVDRSAL